MKFDFYSYFLCGLSTIFHALGLSFVQKCSERESSAIHIFYLSNFFSFPFLLALFLYSNEPHNLLEFRVENNYYSFCFNFFIVVIFGCFLAFSQFWCTTNNTALTTSVIGVVKSLVQTIFGYFYFDNKNTLSNLAILGISVNLIFAIMYTYLKYIEKTYEADYFEELKKSPHSKRYHNMV